MWIDHIKLHFICVACRKCRKSRGYATPKCPHCGKEMKNMGKNFHTPKRSDVKEWERIGIAIGSRMPLRDPEYNYWRHRGVRPQQVKETVKAARKRAESARRNRDVSTISYDHRTLAQSLLDKPPRP